MPKDQDSLIRVHGPRKRTIPIPKRVWIVLCDVINEGERIVSVHSTSESAERRLTEEMNNDTEQEFTWSIVSHRVE